MVYAVVTGQIKALDLARVRQLASNGVIVVLTARDEKRGLEAVNNAGIIGKPLNPEAFRSAVSGKENIY
ncbi:hypothetical protein Prudu_006670 [Prunus dulcis]|uniref:Uncharacterized protein n=1 Tax=Prunus dulcis TaxID=3755 RepID=A0A4Y1R0A7_PRUDU|nr:hypothetical protein Prudu_006670 [Prunus dulcis]